MDECLCGCGRSAGPDKPRFRYGNKGWYHRTCLARLTYQGNPPERRCWDCHGVIDREGQRLRYCSACSNKRQYNERRELNGRRGSRLDEVRPERDTERCVCGCGRRIDTGKQRFRYGNQGWFHGACYQFFAGHGQLPPQRCYECHAILTNRRASRCPECARIHRNISAIDRAAAARTADAQRIRDRNRRSRFKRTYGITVGDAEAILVRQGGHCAICPRPIELDVGRRKDLGKRAFLDHCHKSGKVRGLLCNHCNVGLGHFGDQPDRLERAARYLRSRA